MLFRKSGPDAEHVADAPNTESTGDAIQLQASGFIFASSRLHERDPVPIVKDIVLEPTSRCEIPSCTDRSFGCPHPNDQ
jgi:hypothetical protein